MKIINCLELEVNQEFEQDIILARCCIILVLVELDLEKIYIFHNYDIASIIVFVKVIL